MLFTARPELRRTNKAELKEERTWRPLWMA
jgi:hypothetical protein